ncbi:MFS transporter, partial [Streptomyces olivaceus]|uniref:MFS transporter n=2 Tax=Streptomyces TaxID=1883 RepID=UPI004056CF65
LTLNGFATFAVVIALVPLLTERGMSPTAAAWALGLGGAGQTLGRAHYSALVRHTSVTTRTVALIVAGGATTESLAMTPGPYPLLVLLSVIAGMVRGNVTLLQATAITERWGATHNGTLSGLLAAPVTIAGALAPFAGAALAAALGGYPALFWVLTGMSLGAGLLAAASSRR